MSDPLLVAAEEAAASGDVERVRKLSATLNVQALDDALAYRWWLLLVSSGLDACAAPLAERLSQGPFAERVAAAAAAPPLDADESDLIDPPVTPLRTEPDDTVVVNLFLRWFGGRRDIYARQWYDERRRRTGYHPVEQPLTADVVRAHLEGRITLGQYLLFPDGSVSYGVLDLDLDAGALADLRSVQGPDTLPLDHPALRKAVERLLEVAPRLGLPVWPEDSGGRGAHLWLLVEPRRPARAVRSLLGRLLETAGPLPPEVNVEIFPKQDQPGPKGLSSLVKLPLGVHLGTMRRCFLLDEQLRPIVDQRAALERLRAPAPDIVADVLGRRLAALPAPELEPRTGPPPLPRRETPRSLAEALRAIEPGLEERAACDKILEGCAVVRALVRRAYASRHLSAEEARALLYTIGLVGPACQLIEDVFATAQVSRKELERVRRGLPSPTGCSRLRRLATDLGVECRCDFGDAALPYATPVLYAVGPVRPAAPTWTPFAATLDESGLETADPLATIAEWLRRIEARLSELERNRGG